MFHPNTLVQVGTASHLAIVVTVRGVNLIYCPKEAKICIHLIQNMFALSSVVRIVPCLSLQ